MYDYYVIN